MVAESRECGPARSRRKLWKDQERATKASPAVVRQLEQLRLGPVSKVEKRQIMRARAWQPSVGLLGRENTKERSIYFIRITVPALCDAPKSVR